MPMLNPFSQVNLVPNEKLKQFLLHDDIMVRESVAFYLFESWSPDDDLIQLVLEGCRRYGEESSFATLGFARSSGDLSAKLGSVHRSAAYHEKSSRASAPSLACWSRSKSGAPGR